MGAYKTTTNENFHSLASEHDLEAAPPHTTSSVSYECLAMVSLANSDDTIGRLNVF